MSRGVTSAIGKTAASDRHRPGYRVPRLGEPRRCRQPLRIDKLPTEVKDVIISARRAGQTWKQTADAASAKAGITLSPSVVQRWYDLRIEQPQGEVSSIVPLLREIIDLLKSRLPAVSQ